MTLTSRIGNSSGQKVFSSLSFRMSLITACVFAVVSLGVIWIVYANARNEALRKAEEKAIIILNKNLAIHTYINKEIKPRLFALTDPLRRPDYFDTAWMSSTFAIRQITGINNAMSKKEGYYYKECAINARSPLNEADDFERQFLLELNKNPGLEKRSGTRNIDGKPYFYVLRRGESMEEDCLRCHSEPDKAPGDMVRSYGPERSFHRNVGDIVSAVSIRIPLSQAYADAHSLALRLSLVVIISLVFLFFFLRMLMNYYIFTPLSYMRNKATEISGSDRHLGEEVPVPSGSELNELASTFNTMSRKLKQHMDQLEDRVKERTGELENALAQVKTLKGLLLSVHLAKRYGMTKATGIKSSPISVTTPRQNSVMAYVRGVQKNCIRNFLRNKNSCMPLYSLLSIVKYF